MLLIYVPHSAHRFVCLLSVIDCCIAFATNIITFLELLFPGGRAQRVGVFNFGTDRVRVLEKIFRDGSGMDRVRVFASYI